VAGFTLIELLVALTIFAILAGFAYRGLSAMLESRASLEHESRKWRDVALFVGRFERDLGAVIDRRVALGTSGTRLMPLSSLTESTDSAPGLSWTGIDAAPREEPTVVPVFAGATELTFRFLDAAGVWRATWGAPGSNETGLPAAVEMTVNLASGERITRLVDLPGAPSP
jgi:general secretion pathway protein J